MKKLNELLAAKTKLTSEVACLTALNEEILLTQHMTLGSKSTQVVFEEKDFGVGNVILSTMKEEAARLDAELKAVETKIDALEALLS